MISRQILRTISLIGLSFTAMAATTAEPTLKEIMQGLRDDLLEIIDGLLTDDFERVAQGATGIARHAPIPESQVERMAAELGPEMAAFGRFDELVHQRSLSMIKAANVGDRGAAIDDYRQMVDGCLACHAVYKEQVAAVLAPPSPVD